MKKPLIIFCITLLLITSLTACSEKRPTDNAGKLSIVATSFPQYDWARQILGEHAQDVQLTLLTDNGTDLHNYQPTVADIADIADCDLLLYVGGTSDSWAKDALSGSDKDQVAVALLDTLRDAVKEEETAEGMEHDHDSHLRQNAVEIDEHVWMSLTNAQIVCTRIAEKLGDLDPANAKDYADNAEAYNNKLAALETKYEEMVKAAPLKTIVVGDRFPFRYLVDDLHLDYYAAFPGCSAETEANFETVRFLSGKVDECGLHAVIVTESSDKAIAKTIIANTQKKNQDILVLDSMQSITRADLAGGETYLGTMERNFSALQSALYK